MTYDDLLCKVYDAYYDCRRKKKGKESTIQFSLDYERGVRQLTNDLWNGTYRIGRSIVFPITRPKHREVFAADFRDRIVHHFIINEIGQIVDDAMIADSFSCRVGKGTQYGQHRLQEQIREVSQNYTRPAFTLSMDVHGFFMAIDKRKCFERLERLIRERYTGDVEWMLWLTEMVVMNRPELNCEVRGDKSILDALPDNKTLFRSHGKGFPIGNLTSQIFGNFYLTEFDRWSERYIGDGGRYCRYVDDIRATHTDKKLLMRYIRDARTYLREHDGLELHPTKWSLQPVRRGIPFIGCIVKPWGLYAGNRTVTNAFHAIRRTNDTPRKYLMRVNSYMGFLIHSLTYGIRRKIFNELPDQWFSHFDIVNFRKLKPKNKNSYDKNNNAHRGIQRNRTTGEIRVFLSHRHRKG